MLEMFKNAPVVKKAEEMRKGIDEVANAVLDGLRDGIQMFKNHPHARFANSTTGRLLIVAGLITDIGIVSHMHKPTQAYAFGEETVEVGPDSDEVSVHFEGAPDWMTRQEVEQSFRDEAGALRAKLVSAGQKDVVVSVTFSHGDLVVAEGVDELPNKMSVHIFSDLGGMDCEEFFSDPMSKEQIHEVLQGRSNEMSYMAPGQSSSLVGEDLSRLGHDLFTPVTMMVGEELKSKDR